MKTTFSRHTFFILIIGILFIGSLITLVANQFKNLSDKSIYSHVAQMNIIDILKTSNQSLKELQRRLEAVHGLKVQIENVDDEIMHKHNMVVFQLSDIKAPFNWNRPLLLNYHGQLVLISFSSSNLIILTTIAYILLIILLVAIGFFLCYWAISRVDKLNTLAKNALYQLSENVYAHIALPLEHKEVQSLYNNILKIQYIHCSLYKYIYFVEMTYYIIKISKFKLTVSMIFT